MSRELYADPIRTRQPQLRPQRKHWSNSDGVAYLATLVLLALVLLVIYG
jgi:hypothetical protein